MNVLTTIQELHKMGAGKVSFLMVNLEGAQKPTHAVACDQLIPNAPAYPPSVFNHQKFGDSFEQCLNEIKEAVTHAYELSHKPSPPAENVVPLN